MLFFNPSGKDFLQNRRRPGMKHASFGINNDMKKMIYTYATLGVNIRLLRTGAFSRRRSRQNFPSPAKLCYAERGRGVRRTLTIFTRIEILFAFHVESLLITSTARVVKHRINLLVEISQLNHCL